MARDSASNAKELAINGLRRTFIGALYLLCDEQRHEISERRSAQCNLGGISVCLNCEYVAPLWYLLDHEGRLRECVKKPGMGMPEADLRLRIQALNPQAPARPRR